MQATFTVVRAVGTEFVKRKIMPLMILGGVLAVVLLAAGGWLTTRSAWWWFLEGAFIIGTLIFIVLLIATRIIIGIAKPDQNKEQRQAVRNFVDKLERSAENLQTPQFLILFRIVRDLRRPRQQSFIARVAEDSKTLAPDFNNLRRLFS